MNLEWRIAVPENMEKDCGIYFLRTDVATFDEKTTWDYMVNGWGYICTPGVVVRN